MLIYVTGYLQFSVFSSGHNQMTLQTAIGLQQLGHIVKIVNILDNNATSWEDFNPETIGFSVIQKTCQERADLLIDTIGCLLGSEREALAKATVLFVREPPLLNEIEKCIYPANTLKRCYEGLTEVWTYDLFTPNDCIVLQLLSNCHVRMLPFIWSPLILETYCKNNGIAPWFLPASSVKDAKTNLMIAEVNMNIKSNCTLPLTIWREYSLAHPNTISEVKVVNGIHLNDRQFFKDNVFAHVGGGAILEGRSRSVDWTMNPKSIVLAHLRFSPIRWLYLDCAWMGIPIVHNCLLLKQLGEELGAFYYSNNSVSEGATALKKCYDCVNNNYFNEQKLMRTRYVLSNGLSINRDDAKTKWIEAITHVLEAPSQAPSQAPQAPQAPLQSQDIKPLETIRTETPYGRSY
jgi:hypothetical protein